MEQFFQMLSIQTILFIYMLVGFICRKLHIITSQSRQSYTNFLIDIALPCMIFQSFDMKFTKETLETGSTTLIIASIAVISAYLFGKVAFKWCKPNEIPIMQYGTLVSNSNFAGLPICESAYGQMGLFLGCLFVIPTRILTWSAGISLFTNTDFKTRVKNVLLNPGIIAVELGAIRMLCQPVFPMPVTKSLNALGAMAAPLGMIIVGTILAEIDPRTVINKKAFVLMGVRQFLLPLTLLAALKLFHTEQIATQVAVTMTGMPIGSTTAILADKYGADAVFASKCVFISTLTSLITIPILTLFL